MHKPILCLVTCLSLASQAHSQSLVDTKMIEDAGQDAAGYWRVFTGFNSATVAMDNGAAFLSSSALQLPNGTSTIVTFWTFKMQDGPITLRCFDYFDELLVPNGGGCMIPSLRQ